LKYIIFLFLVLLLTCSSAFATYTGGPGTDNPEVWVGVAGQTYISTGGTMTVTTGEAFEKIAGGSIDYTGEHLEHFTHSAGRLTYTGKPGKDMLVTVSGKVESGETAQEVQICIAENGACHAGSTTGTTFTAVNSHSPISINYIVDLATNDYIEVYATSDSNGDEIIFDNMVISIIQYE